MTGPLPGFAPLACSRPAARAEARDGSGAGRDGAGLPVISWLGVRAGRWDAGRLRRPRRWPAPAPATVRAAARRALAAELPPARACAGYRATARTATTGHDWSTAFATARRRRSTATGSIVAADDPGAGLALRTEIESMAGGALRIRHTVATPATGRTSSTGSTCRVPVPDDARRAARLHRPARARADAAAPADPRRAVAAREPARPHRAGVGDHAGRRPGRFRLRRRARSSRVHVAHSGNSVHWLEREPAGAVTIGGGELLLPGEIVLDEGDEYTTPWVFVVAGRRGSTASPRPLHTWQRSLPAHPGEQPVVLNVWEAVYFDHDLDRLHRPGRPGGRGRRRALRPRRRLVPRPARRPRRARGLVGRRGRLAPGAAPADRARPRRSGWSSGCGSSPRW